ncbi:MAG: 4-alpha-glucanotransferase [Verrucomicrobia bacterium]|nr:4-alpha-glucanotransferase [Verrucomicrobiota bacterium]
MDKRAGILIPLFSLRSKDGFGIGEFLDLILLVDLAEKSGFSLIQLLPVLDTSITKTWKDSYCYSVLSMFALHPIYLRIEKTFSKIPEGIIAEIRAQKEILSPLDEVNYEEVYRTKIDFCKRLYALEEDFFVPTEFIEANKDWLLAYAAFSALRDFFGTSDFSTWTEYKQGTKEVVKEICDASSKHYKAVCFYCFLQFHLHKQFKESADYAKRKGVFLKGDFPVGVHVHSAETWMAPELFVLQRRVGAPPDYFNLKGQNWELPAYNWKEIKKTSYGWFVRRLQHMQQYYQLARIDHVLGYFRFWEIPDKCSRGALGYFQPSLSHSLADLPLDIQMNISRYCEPFISDEILEKLFGEGRHWIIEHFFDKITNGGYRFKKTYQKQKAIELAENISEKEREFLHDLYENVILIQDLENDDVFYPRIGFMNTSSFEFLDQNKKQDCKDLYKVYFSEAEEELWEKEGMEKLSCFQGCTSMEICAEDLGMIPKCTEKVLQELGFLRLHIQRMPKKEEEFGVPSEYEYLSVCSPSNHDTSTLRIWWEEDAERTQRFYNTILKEEGAAPIQLTEYLCEKIIRMHLESGSKWAIFLMQDLLAMSPTLKRKEAEKERINNPAIYPFYWRWRMHKTLEELIKGEFFSSFLPKLLSDSGRSPGISEN